MPGYTKFLAALGFGLVSLFGSAGASSAQQNAVTAIDIALEPDATMIQHAQADNARLLKVFPKGFALDATHHPHVSMLQQFVRTADLDKVYAAADKVFALHDLEAILVATLTGMSVDTFEAEANKWLATAKHPRWNRLYTELVYQPMLDVQQYLRDNGYKTYIVTGGGQDFVRVYAQRVYGIPPEQVVGSMGGTKFGYDKNGKPFLTKEPKLLLNDDKAGKPEGIHLMIGRRPHAAFGNSDGDREMLEYTGAGDGARLMMLVLHDDAQREYAYGPARGLPDTKMGAFSRALDAEAKKNGWTVISMKSDWKRIFAFD